VNLWVAGILFKCNLLQKSSYHLHMNLNKNIFICVEKIASPETTMDSADAVDSNKPGAEMSRDDVKAQREAKKAAKAAKKGKVPKGDAANTEAVVEPIKPNVVEAKGKQQISKVGSYFSFKYYYVYQHSFFL